MADRISNARKKELEQPDPFLESMYKTLDTAKKIKKQLFIGGIIILSIICIISITIYTINSAESKASIMLTEALKNYSNNKEPIEGYSAVKGQFETLLNEYPNTSSGRIGNLRFAEICYSAGQYDMAYKLYTSALDDFKSDSVMQNIILASLAHTCQALKKYDEAEKHFKTIVDGNNSLMKDDALFNLGIGAITNGDNKKGLDFLKKFSSGYENSMYKVLVDDIVARN
ncbi:MAG: tetratricopeptide repeat protein [Desulfamplus sp.]|nr:tetratricopeptide repeat protein [Desulfamplus sp.]